MKKTSPIITALTLTIGVSTALAGRHGRTRSKVNTVFQYTSGGVSIFTGTRTSAADYLGCVEFGVTTCAKAWTMGIKFRVPNFDFYYYLRK